MGFDYERLGRRIAEERKHFNKISQEKMAEDLGMYQADISNIEHAKKGSGITDLSKIELIADYLNVSLESLLFGYEIEQQVIKYSSALKIKDIDESFHIPKKHNDILKKIMRDNYQESLLGIYEIGPYTIYACCDKIECMNDDEFYLTKINFSVVLNNKVISTMVVTINGVSQYAYTEAFNNLASMQHPDSIDIFCVLRIFNPFYYLAFFEEDKEKQAAIEKDFGKRSDELEPCYDEEVLLIESVYVAEDCRKKGIMRMLMDLLQHIFGNHTAWLNLEPTNGTELQNGYLRYPDYTISDIGQINLNASIAERLGFTIDSTIWHIEGESLNSDGKKISKMIETHRYAYKVSPGISQIIKHDGPLVALGHAKEELYRNKVFSGGHSSLYLDEINGMIVAEIKHYDFHQIYYVYGFIDDNDQLTIAVSEESAIHNSLEITPYEIYHNMEDAINSKHYEEMKMIRLYLREI